LATSDCDIVNIDFRKIAAGSGSHRQRLSAASIHRSGGRVLLLAAKFVAAQLIGR
jgi:hypothetical protein